VFVQTRSTVTDDRSHTSRSRNRRRTLRRSGGAPTAADVRPPLPTTVRHLVRAEELVASASAAAGYEGDDDQRDDRGEDDASDDPAHSESHADRVPGEAPNKLVIPRYLPAGLDSR
jgi:hypothetical protein